MRKGSQIMGLSIFALIAALAAGCGAECSPKKCGDLVQGSDLTSNDHTYTECISCYSDGTCDTVLQDDKGNTFFECQDEVGASCTEQVVDAEFAYCEVG